MTELQEHILTLLIAFGMPVAIHLVRGWFRPVSTVDILMSIRKKKAYYAEVVDGEVIYFPPKHLQDACMEMELHEFKELLSTLEKQEKLLDART